MFNFFEFIQYSFVVRAILVGLSIAISSSFLGSFLVLKKFSLIGHGLSHVSFFAIALALIFNQSPLLVSIPIVTLSSILILKLNESNNINADASVGLIASISLALGVILVNKFSNFSIDINSYLFGSILLITKTDVIISIVMAVIISITIYLLLPDLFAITYDEEYAKISGIKTKLLNYILAIMTSIIIVLGTRVVGSLLISSLIIFPTIIALQLTKSFKQTIIYSVLISLLTIILGLFSSFIFDLPSGSTIVLVNGIILFLVYTSRTIVRRI